MFAPTYPIRGGLAEAAFKAGVFKRLINDATLSTLLPGGLHDMRAPNSVNAGNGTGFPYGILMGVTEVPEDRLTTTANNVSLPIAVFSLYGGSQEAAIIMNRITLLLHRQERNVPIEGWLLNRLMFETSQTFEDAGIVQIQTRFGGLLQPIPNV